MIEKLQKIIKEELEKNQTLIYPKTNQQINEAVDRLILSKIVLENKNKSYKPNGEDK